MYRFSLIAAKLLIFLTDYAQALDFCKNKWCKQGHCCGDGHCCTYYYELWWFWLVWLLVAALLCCCFYQQKKIKLRPVRRGRRRSRLGHDDRFSYEESWEEESPSAQSQSDQPRGQTQSYFKPVFDPSKPLVLPSYDDVEQLPKDPPAYDVLFSPDAAPSSDVTVTSAADVTVTSTSDERPPEYVQIRPEAVDESMTAGLLENEETPAPSGRLVVESET